MKMTLMPAHLAKADDPVSRSLDHLRQKRRRILRRWRMVEGLILVWAVVWLLWTTDALWPIESPWIRIALMWLAGGGIVVGWWGLLGRADKQTGTCWGLAQQIEHHLGRRDQPLINALWLTSSRSHPATFSPSADGLSQALVQRVVEQGDQLLSQTNLSPWLPQRDVQKRLAVLLVLLSLTVVLLLFFPVVFQSGWGRWVDPFGDHPPVSWTRLSMTVEPADPIWGQDVRVIARMAGRSVDPIWLVQLDSRGQPISQVPMRLDPQSGLHHRPLLALREPVTLRIQGGRTWSDSLTLTPHPSLSPPNPQGQASADRGSSTDTGDTGETGESGGAGRPIQATAQSGLMELADALDRLANQADRLRQAVGSTSADGSAMPWLGEQGRLLEERLNQVASRTRWHEQWFHQQSASDSRLADGARALGELHTLRLALSATGSGGLSQDASDAGQPVHRAAPIHQAAQSDEQTLRRLLSQWSGAAGGAFSAGAGESADSTGNASARPPSQPGEETTSPGVSKAQGPKSKVTKEIPGAGEIPGELPGVVPGAGVVPGYRQWVGCYYLRISEDGSAFQSSLQGTKP